MTNVRLCQTHFRAFRSAAESSYMAMKPITARRSGKALLSALSVPDLGRSSSRISCRGSSDTRALPWRSENHADRANPLELAVLRAHLLRIVSGGMPDVTDHPHANPLREGLSTRAVPQPCSIVIFGATGDLTHRKLVPALYNLAAEGELPPAVAVIGFARRPKDDSQFRQELEEATRNFHARTSVTISGKPSRNRSSIIKAISRMRPVSIPCRTPE